MYFIIFICVTKRDESRPYGSRPASYKYENYTFNSYP